MSFFDLFNKLDPGPMNRIKEIERQMKEIEQKASNISGVPAERLGRSDSTFVTPVKAKAEFFDCWACKAHVQLLNGQQIVICPFCKEQNEIIRVEDTTKRIDSYQIKTRSPNLPEPESEYDKWLRNKRAELAKQSPNEAVNNAVKPRVADLDNPFRQGGRTTDDDGIIDVEYEEV